MKILLTGATGFLGSHLAKQFIAQEHEVVALRRPASSMRRVENIESNISWHMVDDLWVTPCSVLENVDVVVHTAGSYGRNSEPVGDLFNTNTSFPLRLLEIAIGSGVKSFINTGTALPRALNAYSLSKAQFSEWGEYFAKKGGITFINFALDHMYGPGDDTKKFSDYVIETCLRNQPELLLTEGRQRRDFIFIDDVVAAYTIVLSHIGNGLKGYHDLPLGSGHSVSIREFVETVHQMTRSSTTLRFGAIPYRDNEVMSSEADTRGLQALGWMCRNNLTGGLEKTIRSKLA